mmetsp:Transcript_24764/g.48719  ORF Transcript_24764/g.48719 Transcript_24764/m.48719 type:complete len:642 (+) Transcript_24764:67-1992(+)
MTSKFLVKAGGRSLVVVISDGDVNFSTVLRGKTTTKTVPLNALQAYQKKPGAMEVNVSSTMPTYKKTLLFLDSEEADKFISIVQPIVKVDTTASHLFKQSVSDLSQVQATPTPGDKIGSSSALSRKLRGLVSKKKMRYQKDGFDLDLAYITPKLIAMGFPSEGTAGVYRNPLPEVRRFFQTYHHQAFKIYNLCSEKRYPASKFSDIGGQVAEFPFDDHNPPPFNLLLPLCRDMDKFLKEKDDNVAVIHCKAGKGRTGTVICSYLVFSRACRNAKESLLFFAQNRTKDAKGVTIPSQMRYVYYLSQYLNHCTEMMQEPGPIDPPFLKLKKIFVHTLPLFENGGCTPYFKVMAPYPDSKKVLFDYRKNVTALQEYYDKKGAAIQMDLNIMVRGDVKLQFFDAGKKKKDAEKMFHFWINTRFVELFASKDAKVLFPPSTGKGRAKPSASETPVKSSGSHSLKLSPDPNSSVSALLSPTSPNPTSPELSDPTVTSPSTTSPSAATGPLPSPTSTTAATVEESSEKIKAEVTSSSSAGEETDLAVPPVQTTKADEVDQAGSSREAATAKDLRDLASAPTSFVLTLPKEQIDKARKDKHHEVYPSHMKLELHLATAIRIENTRKSVSDTLDTFLDDSFRGAADIAKP